MTAQVLSQTYSSPTLVADRRWDALQFRIIFAMSFVVFLASAMATRLTPSYWREAGQHRSILAQAWEASGTTAQIAFFG